MIQNDFDKKKPDLPSGPELPRVLGLISIIGIVIGTMIGSGIFINPSKVARDVGTPGLMLVVWILGGILSFFGALAIAELGAISPRPEASISICVRPTAP